MRLADLGFIALLVIASLVIAGKFLPVPYGIMVVGSGSMSPTLEPGDLVIIWGKKFGVGDVIVWCHDPLYCVVHRVIKVSKNYVITKGDANPIPDKPVPLSKVKGRVIASVSRVFWIPPITGLVLYLVVKELSVSAWGRSEEASMFLIYLSYTLIALTLLFVTTNPTISLTTGYRQPTLYLRALTFKGLNILINYTGTEGIRIEGINWLSVNSTPTNYSFGPNWLYVKVPTQVFTESIEKGLKVSVSLSASLSRDGSLIATYVVKPPLKLPKIKASNHSLMITNPNPCPLDFNITFLYAYSAGSPWIKKNLSMRINGSSVITPPKAPYVYARVNYLLEGKEYTLQVRLR